MCILYCDFFRELTHFTSLTLVDDNIHTTAIVPDEVSYIIVTADTDITTDKGFVECEGKSCIINFMNNKSLNLMDLTFNSASRPKQNLDITVRSECKNHAIQWSLC